MAARVHGPLPKPAIDATFGAVMEVPTEELAKYFAGCDPDKPLMGHDPRYVELDDVRGADDMSCVEALERNIRISAESCQLFTGFPGTGKSTELRRLEERLRALKDLPTHVLYIDFDKYVDRYSPLSITDVVRITAHCLDRDATEAEGGDPDKKPGYLKRFFDFVAQTDVQLQKLDFKMFMLELKTTREFHQRIDDALRGRFQQFAEQARESMQESVARLQAAKGTRARRVVVIADSIEKLTPLRDEDREAMEASLETVFLSHAQLLRLPCHVIYTFPLWLRFRTAHLGARYDGEPVVLPMVKVTEKDGSPVARGLDKLHQMLEKRVNIARVFGADLDATLRPMLLASGGYPRDLLRMVRTVLSRSRDFPIGPDDAARLVDRLAEDYRRTLFATELDVLVKVAETHDVPRDSRGELATFVRLLDRWLVLAYRNGAEWYDLHPMIRRDPMVAARLSQKAAETAPAVQETPRRTPS